ncbi:MAG: Gfo/Idh/MocA family oxidoreductase [Planctomycetaceae bacterium]|jgi:predicted dehydrogenase|nr:Gfo/Idh/MocA family oxidoreductase [Planctomycetaceae bacterium]
MTKISRRQFLGQSALMASAAAGMGYAAPHLALGQENKVRPNEQLGVVIVGAGGRGLGSHGGEWLSNPNTKILYFCDPDEKIGNKACDTVAEKNGFRPKFVRDMREAFEDKNLAVMSCASTNHWHALAGVWAVQAGLHCYIEKPISHNVHEGQALVAAAKKYAKCVQTGSQCRSNPANIEANKFIRSGGIGEVKFARGLCYKRRTAIGAKGEFEPPASVDYNLWTGPAPLVPVTRPRFHYDWHWQRLYGNGDLGNQGPHQTDIARWHIGVDRFPNSVISYGGRLGYDIHNPKNNDPDYVDAGDTANTETTIYDYGDKCIVFEVRGLETPSYKGASVGVIVYGSEGYLVQINYSHSIAYDNDGKVLKEFKGGRDSLHFTNFIDAVQKNDPSLLNADARVGALSAGMSHLGNISYYLGEDNKVSVDGAKKTLEGIKSLDNNIDTLERMVEHLTSEKNGVDLKKTPLSMGPLLKIDPEKEVFLDNDKANAMLTREYRGEFVVPAVDKV